MNAEKYTEKSLEALRLAQSLSKQKHSPQIEQEHLLLALLTQQGGLIPQLLQKMGRSGSAVGFAIYLNLLEQIRQTPDFDVDGVLLYQENTPMEQVLSVAAQLREQINLLTTTKLPKNLRWRKLYQLREGEAILVEDNG